MPRLAITQICDNTYIIYLLFYSTIVISSIYHSLKILLLFLIFLIFRHHSQHYSHHRSKFSSLLCKYINYLLYCNRILHFNSKILTYYSEIFTYYPNHARQHHYSISNASILGTMASLNPVRENCAAHSSECGP